MTEQHTITITTDADETVQVTGRLVGDLLVAISLDDHAGWSVWHVPTCHLFDKARPESLPRRCSVRKLVEWCEKIQSDRQADWQAMRSLGWSAPASQAQKDATRDLRGRVLEHCRGVEL